MHNWFWNQFSVLFRVISCRKCPAQNVFSCVHCWVCDGKHQTQGLPWVSRWIHCPTTAFWCSPEKNVKSQWENLMCNVIKLSPLPQAPVLLRVHVSFLSDAPLTLYLGWKNVCWSWTNTGSVCANLSANPSLGCWRSPRVVGQLEKTTKKLPSSSFSVNILCIWH